MVRAARWREFNKNNFDKFDFAKARLTKAKIANLKEDDNADDFASTVGIGAIVSTKFTWAHAPKRSVLLTAEKEAEWRKWIALYNDKRLAQGHYRGELYDLGFDKPEAHAIAKDGRCYYAFYADRWDGPVELRGLAEGRYRVADIWSDRAIGQVSAKANRLTVTFERFLLLEATPLKGT